MNNFLSNPRVFVLLVALIIVSGLAALQALPRDEDPRIGNRHAIVMTEFPGASAERVEALVTEPLESQLRELPEVRHIDSRSSAGFSSMTVELFDEVAPNEVDAVWAELRDKVEQARALLPSDARKPFVEDRRSYPFTMIIALRWAFADQPPDLLVLGRYADELESHLRRLSGVDFIALQGRPQEEIVVDVDAAKAGAMGLSPHAIGLQVFQADAKTSAGEIHNDQLRVAVEVEGALDTLERIRRIPLRQLSTGEAVLVGDLAEIKRQAKIPVDELAIVHGQRAVVLGIRMLSNQRSDLWSERVRQELQAFQQTLPANITTEVIFDQEHYTAHRLEELAGNIVLGFGLIVVVLLFTLGWRSALIVSTALPLTVLFAFACMQIVNLPIHQMSVTGLIVALGIMVDNAIVMADTVNRYKQRGIGGLHATHMAVKHLWLPLLGSTLTTMLAFMPIVIMPGASGEFVGGIALTVIFSLLGSYLVSHIIVAGLAGRFLQRHKAVNWWQDGLAFNHLNRHFERSLLWSLTHPKKVLALVMVLPLMGFVLGSTLPEQFFPPADRDMINLEVFLPAAASIEQTTQLTEAISADIEHEPGVESLHWFIGRSAPMFYYNLKQGKDNSQYYAQAMLTADHFSDANRLVPLLQQRLDERFPEAQIILRRLEQGPPFDAPVELRLVGPELAVLKKLGDELRRRALGIEDVVHVRNNLTGAVPKLWLEVNENQSLLAGLGLRDVATQLSEGVDGAITGSVLEGTESLPVRVQAQGQKQVDLSGVHSWILVPESQQLQGEAVTGPVPYAALGDIDIRPEIGVIPRRDGERINTLQVYIRDAVLPAVVLNRLKASLEAVPLSLPAGYRIEVAGEDEKRSEAVGKLVGSMGVIGILLVVALVMSFNSFRLSATIFLVAFQAAGLGMLALAISRAPFGFTSIIGLMGLIGLAINAGIVILAELKTDARALAGDQQAIAHAVMSCSRHIISTTITTVMGFLPLILSGGAFWPPFAFVIAGGTVFTTMVSFYFVPVAFSLMTRERRFELSRSAVAELV